MDNEAFRSIIKEFADTAANASDEFYDAAFYAVGNFDFDETNPSARWTIGALIAEKATIGSVYAFKRPPEFWKRLTPSWGVYMNPNGDETYLPKHVANRVRRRKAKELKCKLEQDIIYIPDGKASNGATVAGYLARAAHIGKYGGEARSAGRESRAGHLVNNAVREFNGYSIIGKIMVALLVLWVIIKIALG